MPQKSNVVLASSCLAGCVVGAVTAVVVGSVPDVSVVSAVVAGSLIGTFLAMQVLLIGHVREVAGDWRPLLVSTVGLIALLGLLPLASLQSGVVVSPLWPGIACFLLIGLAWVGVLRANPAGGANTTVQALDESTTQSEATGEPVTLPEEAGCPGWSRAGRIWRWSQFLLAMLVAGQLTIFWREPVFFGLGLVALLFLWLQSAGPTRITDDGLVFEHRLARMRVGSQLVEWDTFEGYRQADDSVTLVYDDVWGTLVYESGSTEEFVRSAGAIDRHLDRVPE